MPWFVPWFIVAGLLGLILLPSVPLYNAYRWNRFFRQREKRLSAGEEQ